MLSNRLLLFATSILFMLQNGHTVLGKQDLEKQFVQNLIDKTKEVAEQPIESQGDFLGQLFSSAFDIKRAAQQVTVYGRFTDSQKSEFHDIYCDRIKMQYGTSEKLSKFMQYTTTPEEWRITKQQDDTILITMVFSHKNHEEPDVPIGMTVKDNKICDITIENISVVQTNTDEFNAEFNGNDIAETLKRLKKRN